MLCHGHINHDYCIQKNEQKYSVKNVQDKVIIGQRENDQDSKYYIRAIQEKTIAH